MKTYLTRIACAAVLLVAFAHTVAAQTYPSRSDHAGRAVRARRTGGFSRPADRPEARARTWASRSIVDNRPGANTIIGAQAVAKAKPDGYTLLMAIDGTLVMNPFLYSKLAYDPFKDFAPISLIALVPSALVGNINVPVQLDQGADRAGEGQARHVPDRHQHADLAGQCRPAQHDGRHQLHDGAVSRRHHADHRHPRGRHSARHGEHQRVAAALARQEGQDSRAGRARSGSRSRPKSRPSPRPSPATISASGRASWRPPARRARSSTSCTPRSRKVLAMPDVREKLATAGIEPAISKSPEEFAAFIRSQADIRAKVIQAVGMKLD